MIEQINTAEIISVGTELLVGHTVNTNATWIARQLSLLGISCFHQTVVGDNPDRLRRALDQALSRCDLVITTGGLGPTQDDITMEISAAAAGLELAPYQPAIDHLNTYFTRFGHRNMTQNNLKQANLPLGADVMLNTNGTAPGAILPVKGGERPAVIALLPGPPSEMSVMFTTSLLPWLKQRTSHRFHHIFIRMIGIGESAAETALEDLIAGHDNPSLAPYAGEGEVIFRITQRMDSLQDTDLTGPLLAEVQQRLGEYIYEIGERRMPQVLKDLLIERGLTISFAESCTAGLTAAQFAENPGVSACLQGGIVSYDDQVKRQLLGVSDQTLREQGAVSEACALEMAAGCRKLLNSDYAVAVTGIAGPDGGSEEKPVGTVWLACAGPHGLVSERHLLRGQRNKIRQIAALRAMDLARRQVLA